VKKKLYLADINGTLTYARQPVSREMASTMVEFAEKFPFAVVTGSPWHEVKDMMPDELIEDPDIDFWCSMGNNLFREGKELRNAHNTIDFEFFHEVLEDARLTCPYQFRKVYRDHFEVNANSINFSMLGRPLDGEPPIEDRREYEAWDAEVGQRRWLIKYLSKLYPEYDIMLGGQISIDIVKKGCGKEQIVDYYKDRYDISFFGDRIESMGNDNTIAHVIADIGGSIYSVDSPEETLTIMRSLISMYDGDEMI
jgi:phosphomannomutase